MKLLLTLVFIGASDIPLIEAPQPSAPVCIEFCTSMNYQGLQMDAWQDKTGHWNVGLSVLV